MVSILRLEHGRVLAGLGKLPHSQGRMCRSIKGIAGQVAIIALLCQFRGADILLNSLRPTLWNLIKCIGTVQC
jgi:hypothetical protein